MVHTSLDRRPVPSYWRANRVRFDRSRFRLIAADQYWLSDPFGSWFRWNFQQAQQFQGNWGSENSGVGGSSLGCIVVGHGFARSPGGRRRVAGDEFARLLRSRICKMWHAIPEAICSCRSMAHGGGRHGANDGRNSFRVDRIQCLGKRGIVGWERFIPNCRISKFIDYLQ